MSAKNLVRRTLTVVLGLGLVAGLFGLGIEVPGQVVAPGVRPLPQPFPPPQPPVPGQVPGTSGGGSKNLSGVTLLDDWHCRQKIEMATESINDQDWNKAVEALQILLDANPDSSAFVREKDANGVEKKSWRSGKVAASNLFRAIPNEGLDVYESSYGGLAKMLLDEAKASGDHGKLAEVAQRYQYTKAGTEANDLLATHFLDRGQYFLAALRLEQLLAMNPKRTLISDLTLFKAALAFKRAGDEKRFDEVWHRLEPSLKAQGGLKIGGNVVSIARIDEVLKENLRNIQVNPHDWTSIRGDASNSAQANGSQPLLDQVMWERLMALDTDDLRMMEKNEGKRASDQIAQAIQHQRDVKGPIMSGFFPIATHKLAFYRTNLGIRAVHLQNSADPKDGPFAAGDTAYRMVGFKGSLAEVLDDPKLGVEIERFLTQQFNNLPGNRSFLYENSLLGTLYADQQLIYVVDDLAVPLPASLVPGITSPTLKSLVLQNTLMAFNIQTGKAEWVLGVSARDHLDYLPRSAGVKDDPFANSHFLSVPMSVGGKLYVLNEKHPGDCTQKAELRLVCIDPNKIIHVAGIRRPTVISIQKLGDVEPAYRFTNDASRRTNAAHLAYGDGILVCSTNAGMMLGVDLLSGSLAWSYPYRQQPPPTQPFDSNPLGGPRVIGPGRPGIYHPVQMVPASLIYWKSSPPVIQDGKVVFATPDASAVHCVNLRDGASVWEKPREEGDLFLAGVYSGKVLIVGRNSLRALSLKNNGDLLWQVNTGYLPSGQGVANRNVYYLPLENKEILAVDIERGSIKAHNRASQAQDAPGNLLFYEGVVLSQTPEKVVAYPQLTSVLDLANAEIKKDPDNPEKLLKRGEMLLADGQLDQSVKDLRLALKNGNGLPEGRKIEARSRLYEALTGLLHADFAKASGPYLDEYREMCKTPDRPADEPERMAKYLRIVGEGNEALGNLVEAFRMYREFGSLPTIRDGGVPLAEDPSQKMPTNVWLRGRISTMMGASDDKRRPLEAQIAEEWKLVKAKKDLDAIRTFVDMFDIPVPVGRQARLHLAETIVESNERGAFLEAELNLQQLRGSDYFTDADITGRALLTLARLEEKKGTAESMKMAAAYYRQLGHDFRDVPVASGKPTGAVLLEELATDPRYLPYFAEAGPLWSGEKIAARETDVHKDPVLGFVFSPEGELSPLMKQHRLILDASRIPPRLQLYNFATDTVRWAVDLGTQTDNRLFSFYQQAEQNGVYNPNARFRFSQVRGNLGVLQVATTAYCLNMETGQLLWQDSLTDGLPLVNSSQGFNGPTGPFGNGGFYIQSVEPDADGNLEVWTVNQFNNNERKRIPMGRVGSVQSTYVALITPKGLVVLDPLRGTVLWQKKDVSIRTRVFGDEQHLFLIEDAGGGIVGSGRVIRAIDGTMVQAPDFSSNYQNRLSISGRKILSALPGANLTVKMTDLVSGKDLWSHSFPGKSVVLQSEDPGLAGIVDPKGRIVVIDIETGQVALQSIVPLGHVEEDDLARLQEPLLLADRDHVYVALNRPIDEKKVFRSLIQSNFNNGLRCRNVNGWVLAFFRTDGRHKENGIMKDHKKGDFHWQSIKRVENQLVVVEQFDILPVILFTARYAEVNLQANGPPFAMNMNGNRWYSATRTLQRSNGKEIYDPDSHPSSTSALFATMSIDPREGTINLIGIGNNRTVQHYVDDGTKAAPTLPGNETSSKLIPKNAPPEPIPPPFIAPPQPPIGPPVRRLPVRPVQPAPLPLPNVPAPVPLRPPGGGGIAPQAGGGDVQLTPEEAQAQAGRNTPFGVPQGVPPKQVSGLRESPGR